MKEQEKEASEVISRWEESYAALEERYSELSAALEAKEANTECLSSLQTRLDETQATLEDTKAKLNSGEKAKLELQGMAISIGHFVRCVQLSMHSISS